MKRYWIILALFFLGMGISTQLSATITPQATAAELDFQGEKVTWDEAQMVLAHCADELDMPFEQLTKAYLNDEIQISSKGDGWFAVEMKTDGGDILTSLINTGL